MPKKFQIAAGIAAGALALLLCALLLRPKPQPDATESGPVGEYILRAYENTVALYAGDTTVKIYEDVVLSNLPAPDRSLLYAGIAVDSVAAADRLAEDYDG